MARRLLPAEDALLSASPRLGYPVGLPCGREAGEGAPQSPLTSCSGSQGSSAADLADHPAARALLAAGARPPLAMDASASDTPPSSHRSLDSRSTAASAGCGSDLPSPGLPARSRPGRSRAARPAGPPADLGRQPRRGSSASSYHRHLFKQATKVGSGGSLADAGFQEAAWSFEAMVAAVRSLPAGHPAVPAVAEGLHYMDSRAVAALLKDIAKKGLPQRAIEIFDWLRGLPDAHELAPLRDVYTYTTVISLCGQRQSLRLALELVAEMRSRAIACNVHTYSALMNTCIKCGELELALDVFDRLKVEGCAANVVTYNTLVDVYGKLGRWQDAIDVLDRIYMEGLQPETRTFNTVIIAANICNQPHEALRVYDRMIASNFQPTDTTFTALVSAYCKAGQLDNALHVFEQMLQQRCERNIITYGSLIGACEKAGRWELALRLYDEMRRDQPPVAPNTMTYNALLGACAQGAQSEKAEALFHAMLARRCKPDQAAHTMLLLAHTAAGHWRAALQSLEAMQAAGYCPEPPAYAALLHCLWESGVGAAQAHAVALFEVGARSRLLASPLHVDGDKAATEVHIAAANSSLAVLALLHWLRQLLHALDADGSCSLGHVTRICFDAGQQEVWLADVVTQAEAAIMTVLEGLKSPFRVEAAGATAGLIAESAELEAWLQLDQVAASVTDFVPLLPTDALRGGPAGRAAAAQEAAAIARQAESHALFRKAEGVQESRTAAAQAVYGGSRPSCVCLAAQLARRLGLPAEAAYRALVLLDYALVAGLPFPPGGAAVQVAACLVAAATPLGVCVGSQLPQDLEDALQLQPGTLLPVLEQLRERGADQTPVVSPTTALHRYVSYLLPEPTAAADRRSSDALLPSPRARTRAAGDSARFLAAAMTDPAAAHLPPSLLAAAALAADRVGRGCLPVWPAGLAAWTGLALDGGAERCPLAAAARLVIRAERAARTDGA